MRKAILILMAALVLLGVTFYLHSIDHMIKTVTTTTVHLPFLIFFSEKVQLPATVTVQTPQGPETVTVEPSGQTVTAETTYIHPPYANLWPEILAVSVVLLALAIFLLIRPKKDPL
ncbi:hypothetical protein [Saccharolobus shibatae]|uniref:Uncharacterized protein n=1 Tax=Saccharolobus shibatae TaxID=2286 RepID=A0A8F5GWH4_9CREN|nr:hypothetical protein [Saccharolobus shibatae]QXJ32084.1 hypothetical protein J5U21_01735 [Saccharolobus shibatae]